MKRLGLLLALGACGGTPAAKGGTAELRFAVTSDVMTSANLVDPLKGTFYGNIFLQEDVSVTGPRADAMKFQDLELKNLDLSAKAANAPSDVSLVTGTLAVGKYVVLGFFDVDGNGAVTGNPDKGDPVTLAVTNQFEVLDGVQTKRLVLFELVFN